MEREVMMVKAIYSIRCPFCNKKFSGDYEKNYERCIKCYKNVCKSCIRNFLCPDDWENLNQNQKDLIDDKVENYSLKMLSLIISVVIMIVIILLSNFPYIGVIGILFSITFALIIRIEVQKNIRAIIQD